MIPKAIKNETDINEAMGFLLLDDFSVYGDDAALFAKPRNGSRTTPIPLSPRCGASIS